MLAVASKESAVRLTILYASSNLKISNIYIYAYVYIYILYKSYDVVEYLALRQHWGWASEINQLSFRKK